MAIDTALLNQNDNLKPTSTAPAKAPVAHSTPAARMNNAAAAVAHLEIQMAILKLTLEHAGKCVTRMEHRYEAAAAERAPITEATEVSCR